MENIINNQSIENLLIANWANVLNTKKLIATTLKAVRDNKDTLNEVIENDLPNKGVQIILSRFKLIVEGFELWIDFTVPSENEIAVGTIEAFLSNSGTLTVKRVVGTRFVKPHLKI